MADARRWSRSHAVHKDEDLMAAPAFIDRHGSDHLSEAGASWHGPRRRWIAAASIFVIAGFAFIAAFTVWDLASPGGGGGPSSPGDAGAAAQQGGGAPPGATQAPDLGALLNSTTQTGAPAP